MTVIALASSKGGCGKSTTALALASAFHSSGVSVAIVDADPSRRLVKWGETGGAKIATVVPATEKTIRREVDRLTHSHEIILIDVEGTPNLALAIGIGLANLVIVPANPSAPDVEDGLSTIQYIRDLESGSQRRIPYGLVWTRFPTLSSRELVALNAEVIRANVPIIGALAERTAYKSLFSFSAGLADLPRSEVPGVDKALSESQRLAELVLDHLEKYTKEDGSNHEH